MLDPYNVGDTVSVRRWSKEQKQYICGQGVIMKQIPENREYVVKTADGVECVYLDIHVFPPDGVRYGGMTITAEIRKPTTNHIMEALCINLFNRTASL